MFRRTLMVVAILVLLSPALVHANTLHTEKGASGQGLATDAFFEPPITVNGISVTPFDDQGTIFDIFQIPSSFTSGTPYSLTFGDIGLGYGIFDCANGSSNFAVSDDMPPINIGSTCTPGPLGSNDSFVNFNESGNTSTISFLGGAGAPSTFFFWTTDGNLLDISPLSATVSTPEPPALFLLAFSLGGLAVFRKQLGLASSKRTDAPNR